jgi:hypothetical protein
MGSYHNNQEKGDKRNLDHSRQVIKNCKGKINGDRGRSER